MKISALKLWFDDKKIFIEPVGVEAEYQSADR